MKFLVVECDLAYLADAVTVWRSGLAAATIVDLRKAAVGFRGFAPDTGATFNLPQAAAFGGINLRLARYWLENGVIRPTHQGNGRGHWSRYTHREAFAIGVCGALHKQGVGLPMLARAFKMLTETEAGPHHASEIGEEEEALSK